MQLDRQQVGQQHHLDPGRDHEGGDARQIPTGRVILFAVAQARGSIILAKLAEVEVNGDADWRNVHKDRQAVAIMMGSPINENIKKSPDPETLYLRAGLA